MTIARFVGTLIIEDAVMFPRNRSSVCELSAHVAEIYEMGIRVLVAAVSRNSSHSDAQKQVKPRRFLLTNFFAYQHFSSLY